LVAVGVYLLVHSSSPTPTPKPAPVVHPKTTQSKPASPQQSGSNNSNHASGSSNQALNNTGPGDVVAVFVAAAGVGYMISLRVLRNRNDNG